jgi:polyisoprenoid-binding protein YceI
LSESWQPNARFARISQMMLVKDKDPTTMKLVHATATACFAALMLAACSAPEAPPLAEGDWALDSEASRLTYVSVKSGEIAETNEFEKLTGSVAADGAAKVDIDLASLETGVDIRNERMGEFFFNIAEFPTASITAKVDPATFEKLGVGESTTLALPATLSVKGVEAPVEPEVTVTRTGPDRVTVVATKPVIVMADALELTEGLAKLQELAGLPSITPAVPVTFSLAFDRK